MYHHLCTPHLLSYVAFGHARFVELHNRVNIQIQTPSFTTLEPFGAECSTPKIAETKPFKSSPLFEKGAADIENVSNLLDRLSGKIEVCNVVKIKRRNFTGHVYNLQTEGGWFAANGIITHNCKHVLNTYIPTLADDPDKDKAQSNRPFEDGGTN